MTTPSTPDYLNLSNAVYTSGGTPTAPSGWSVMTVDGAPLMESDSSTGMQAVAFENNTTGQIVIAYEGTNLSNITGNPSMFAAQASADKGIGNGVTPDADGVALSFAEQVAGDAGGNPIYLTGHSLGGEEAEYVEANASSVTGGIAGGATFGAPGVPNQTAVLSSSFIDYVNYGDLIGNFVPSDGARVGNVVSEGTNDEATINSLLTSLNPLDQVQGLGMTVTDHLLGSYAADFGVTLSSSEGDTTTNVDDDTGFLDSIEGYYSAGEDDLVSDGYFVPLPALDGGSATDTWSAIASEVSVS
jgi:Protein of unknown function (DUF2974)